jgi:chemotaxis protein CheX
MAQTIQLSDVREYMVHHLADVFSTMLSLQAALATVTDLPHFPDRVSGCVGFGGETVNGIVYLHISSAFARTAAGAMLGLPPEELTGEQEINDVVGELTNMLAGGLKSWLCDAGSDCAVSTPAIIRGTSFEIEASPEVAREVLVFDCGSERLILEVHIKLG